MTFKLHLESRRLQSPEFHLDAAAWASAAARHPHLAAQIDVSFGWDQEVLAGALDTCNALIASKFDKSVVNQAPHLRWIHTTAAGVEQLMPLSELRDGLVFTNSSGIHRDKAAEFAAMALLMLNARMPELIANQQHGRWNSLLTSPVRGKKVVVLGFGDLGQSVGQAALMLGLNVVAVTKSGVAHAEAPDVPVMSLDRLDELLPTADFVFVTVPLTSETRGLLDARRLRLMSRAASLVNIGRAAVVDYDTVAAMLERGEMAGAVLDVFEDEPLTPASPFWHVPGLVVTPHISCDAPDYNQRVLDLWFANFELLQAGKPLRNQVDRARGY